MKVDNAIIMAAGTANRFAPLSYEIHKALIEVKGEVYGKDKDIFQANLV